MDEPLRRFRLVFILSLFFAVTVTSPGAHADAGTSWHATVLCTKAIASGYRSLAVDERGFLTELTTRRDVAPGARIAVAAAPLTSDDSTSVLEASSVRLLGRTRGPLLVRARVIENDSSHYDLRHEGRSSYCRVAFQEPASISVAKLMLGRRTALTLTIRDGRLLHLLPREEPLDAPSRTAKARADAEGFLALIARGRSIAACALASSDALLIHGGPLGCVALLSSAQFHYRERYRGAFVTRAALFNLSGDTYALATIRRSHDSVRAVFILERGRYRYLCDFVLSPIELW